MRYRDRLDFVDFRTRHSEMVAIPPRDYGGFTECAGYVLTSVDRQDRLVLGRLKISGMLDNSLTHYHFRAQVM